MHVCLSWDCFLILNYVVWGCLSWIKHCNKPHFHWNDILTSIPSQEERLAYYNLDIIQNKSRHSKYSIWACQGIKESFKESSGSLTTEFLFATLLLTRYMFKQKRKVSCRYSLHLKEFTHCLKILDTLKNSTKIPSMTQRFHKNSLIYCTLHIKPPPTVHT